MRPRAARTLYLLDTNVVSDLRRPLPSPEVVDWIERQPPRSLAVSFSTVFEIQYGAELSRRQSPEKATCLEGWLEGFILSGTFRILRPCAWSARIRAKMHATPSLRGFLETRPGASKPPNGEKLTIAAQAIAVGAVVVTMNDRDFARIHEHFPIPGVLNPMTDTWAVHRARGSFAPPYERWHTEAPDPHRNLVAGRTRRARWEGLQQGQSASGWVHRGRDRHEKRAS